MKEFFKDFIKKRRYLHFGVTIIIGFLLYPLFMYMNHSVQMGIIDKILMIIVSGGLFGGSINLIREFYFDNESIKKDGISNFDKYDVIWGTIGGIIGAVIAALLF